MRKNRSNRIRMCKEEEEERVVKNGCYRIREQFGKVGRKRKRSNVE